VLKRNYQVIFGSIHGTNLIWTKVHMHLKLEFGCKIVVRIVPYFLKRIKEYIINSYITEKDVSTQDDSKLEALLLSALKEKKPEEGPVLFKLKQKFVVDDLYNGPRVPNPITIESVIDMISYFKVTKLTLLCLIRRMADDFIINTLIGSSPRLVKFWKSSQMLWKFRYLQMAD
jgi:hypothetical protein